PVLFSLIALLQLSLLALSKLLPGWLFPDALRFRLVATLAFFGFASRSLLFPIRLLARFPVARGDVPLVSALLILSLLSLPAIALVAPCIVGADRDFTSSTPFFGLVRRGLFADRNASVRFLRGRKFWHLGVLR